MRINVSQVASINLMNRSRFLLLYTHSQFVQRIWWLLYIHLTNFFLPKQLRSSKNDRVLGQQQCWLAMRRQCKCKVLLKSLTFIHFVELFWVGSLCDVIAITSQRYPTQNNSTFMYTKSADLYRGWATGYNLLVVDAQVREIFRGGSNQNK